MKKHKGSAFPAIVPEGNTLSSVSDPLGKSLQTDCFAFRWTKSGHKLRRQTKCRKQLPLSHENVSSEKRSVTDFDKSPKICPKKFNTIITNGPFLGLVSRMWVPLYKHSVTPTVGSTAPKMCVTSQKLQQLWILTPLKRQFSSMKVKK